MGSEKVERYKHRVSIVIGVLQMLTGACAIIFWGVAYKFERQNNLLGYRRTMWKVAAGCWCGALFMIFPAGLALLSGIKRSKITIRWHFWTTVIFLCTFGPIYMGWSAAAIHTTTHSPAWLCQGAYRNVNCRVNTRVLTMYGLSLVAALLQLLWLTICCIISGQIVCGKPDKHNTSALGASLQCGHTGSLPPTPTLQPSGISLWFGKQDQKQPQGLTNNGRQYQSSPSPIGGETNSGLQYRSSQFPMGGVSDNGLQYQSSQSAMGGDTNNGLQYQSSQSRSGGVINNGLQYQSSQSRSGGVINNGLQYQSSQSPMGGLNLEPFQHSSRSWDSGC